MDEAAMVACVEESQMKIAMVEDSKTASTSTSSRLLREE